MALEYEFDCHANCKPTIDYIRNTHRYYIDYKHTIDCSRINQSRRPHRHLQYHFNCATYVDAIAIYPNILFGPSNKPIPFIK